MRIRWIVAGDAVHLGRVALDHVLKVRDVALERDHLVAHVLCHGKAAGTVARGPVVTASVSNITFLRPVKVGDRVCCYTDLNCVGSTSLTLCVEVWVLREDQGDRIKVTEAEFTFMAINAFVRPHAFYCALRMTHRRAGTRPCRAPPRSGL
jgi:hypothetical protein